MCINYVFLNKGFIQLAEICMVSQQLETKTTTVLVEVHQSEDEDAVNTGNQVN